MTDDAALVYLEADDEITSVVRRLRDAPPGHVVIVAPGRSRATSSVVALRLLARAGEEDGREIAVVGDALTRSLAAEAGLQTYLSVTDARAATPVAATEPEPRHAAIHVVRGGAGEETTSATAVAPAPAPTAAGAETLAVPVSRARPAVREPTVTGAVRPARPRRAVVPLVGVLVVAAALIGSAAFVGATVLPAATIRLVPRTEAVGPVEYDVVVENPERVSGTVTATESVTATGSYAIQAAATGQVVFRNFNTVPVEVPAGTSVAAGDVVFTTTDTVTGPPGSLTESGTIAGGEVTAGIVAAGIGPAGNVGAEAIDTILDPATRNRLRGFPQNTARLVVNPEATAGGTDTAGVEITQADVDAAVAALHESLATMVAERLAATEGALHADAFEPAPPVVTGTDGLVGRRDEAEAEITGELPYDRLVADEAKVESLARERFATDADLLPEGHELLGDSITVEIGAVERRDDRLIVEATVRGQSIPRPDRAEIVGRVVGLSEEEAEAVLAPLGTATVDLWPGWVAEVPANDWRIDVEIAGTEPADPVPVPSGS